MRNSRTTFLLLLGFLLAALATLVGASRTVRGQTPTPTQLRKAADQHFAEKSYAIALDEYRRWLAQVPKTIPGRTAIEYRVAVALGKAQKWDEALAAADRFAAQHRNEPLWAARGEYWRGLLLNTVPHEGYKVGARLYRGNDYPHTSEAETPQQVWLQADDQKAALKSFEAAIRSYETMPAAERRAVASEEIDLHFDLAKFLPQVQSWGSPADWKAAKTTDWAINPAKSYDPAWPAPKKILFLYARLPRLRPGDAHLAALTGLAPGLYVAQFHNAWALRQPPKWQIVQTIPYHKLDPIMILQHTAASYPVDPQAPQMLLLAAQWTQGKGDAVGAVARFRALVARYPASKWAEDARQAVQDLLRESVTLGTPGPQPSDRPAGLTLSVRNVKSVILRAYQIKLEAMLLEPSKLENAANRFGSFDGNFGGLREAKSCGPKVAEWTYTVKHPDSKRPFYETESITTPLHETGAYLVEAEGDDGRVRGGAVVLISNLAVVKKTDKDNALCFVADARSGRPVPGAKVVVREIYWDGTSSPGRYKVIVSRGQADADGIFNAPRLRRPNISDAQVEAFAYAPGSRYALTNTNGWYWGDGDGGNRDEIKCYAYTDRPVYRPKQTVYFRALLARRTGGSDFAPLVGVPVTVKVVNPKGEQISTTTADASQFGSVNGSFPLPVGAPLGEYSVMVSVPNAAGNVSDYGGSRFRVEEYKKPEYEVKVMPSTAQARFGEKVTATVNATYYFGAPVQGSKVSYKVFRSPFYPSYRFPQPYDWFYQYYGNGDYTNEYADQGELVTQGEAITDAKGNAFVTFLAEKGTRGYAGDYAYTVKADVVDASRRQISGEGVLKVTNQQFYAYLNVPNGFYRAGDKVQIELRTQDANEKPVAAKGTLIVSRLLYDVQGRLKPTPVHTETVTTDADGKAFVTWATDVSGQYEAKFAALDQFEKPVVASAPVWVAGDDMADRAFRVGGITLMTDKTTYNEGETAHVLIVADQPDDWVMLTQETGNQILKRSLLHVPGRSRTVDIPIVRAHVPNFALGAVAVRDYQFYAWQKELFVPPARQFVKMDVTGDKAEYRPGETGHFEIRTTDAAGKPVASEVSLAVVDSALFYIQKDYAPDIRLFYYGERRAISINADASQNFGPPTRSESDIAEQHYKPHGIHLPDLGRLPGGYYYPYYYGDLVGGGFEDGRRGDFGGGMGGFAPEAGTPMAQDQLPAARAANGPMTPPASVLAKVASRPELAGMPAGQARFAPAKVRDYFPDTAFWTPAVVTDQTNGTARVDVKFPDTLTTWKATARGLTTGVQVGAGDAQVITDKKLLVRLESPRFFVERDKVVLSAIVRNDLKTAKQVRVSLETDPTLLATEAGVRAGGLGALAAATSAGSVESPDKSVTVTIPAGSEKRVDWMMAVVGSGTASIKMVAETDEESDAVQQSFPVLAYGVQKFVAGSGVLQKDQSSARLTITVPKDHQPGSAALLIQINPSLAATTLDALPYLADYPYGCVEQTMSRFLPSVVVARTLREAGVDLETLHKRALALQEREQGATPFGQKQSTDSSTDQTGYTYPTGTPGVLKTPLLAEGLPHGDRWDNPVFDPARLKSMVDEGLARLLSMQRGDGGWGWWRDSSESDPYMSAYVVYGLAAAKSANVAVPADVLARGCDYLARDIKDRDDERDLAIWEAYALSLRGKDFPAAARKIVGGVYAERERLSAYGQALLALTLHNLGESEKAAVVCRNLQNTASIDSENGTATWKTRYGYWWDWYNNDTETVSWVLKAYITVLPKSEITPMLVKWLVTHQRGSVWHSTKETAMAVYALTDYIRANNELAPDYAVTVALGDKVKRTYRITRDNALLFDNRFLVADAFLPGGPETVTITKQGAGRLYYSSALQYVTTEEQIKGVGTELKVQRRYFRLTPKTAKQADWDGGTFNTLDYTRTELADGTSLKSGDLIEVELVLDSKNEYDYCIFEDMKPAGCEPLELRSGQRWGNGLCSNMELRDTKTAFFVDHLPQGTRVLRYRLRAEVPGAFHALPTNGYAMYAPDVRALSDGWHVSVTETALVSKR